MNNNILIILNTVNGLLYITLCLQNVPPLTCYNLDIHDPISIVFFGRTVTTK